MPRRLRGPARACGRPSRTGSVLPVRADGPRHDRLGGGGRRGFSEAGQRLHHRGLGMLTLDTTIRPAVGRVLARPSASLAPRIVIAGGGFAGVTTALELARRCAGVLPIQITLLSNRNFFLFTPMLAEAATGAVETRHVLYPIRPLCGAWGIEFAEMAVESIDLERKRLVARHHRAHVAQHLDYDM